MTQALAENPQESTVSRPDAKASLQAVSLKLAGYLYLAGDASMFVSGVMKKQYKEAATGLAWGAGGLAAARYGEEKSAHREQRLGRALGDYLRGQDVPIPQGEGLAANELLKPATMFQRAEDFAYQHPSELLNASYAIGSVSLLKSGLENQNYARAASGALVGGGAMAGLLVQETHAKSAEPPSGMLGKAKHWVQEKPLRISSVLYALNNVSSVMAGVKDRKISGQAWIEKVPATATTPAVMEANPLFENKSYYFTFLTVGCYLAANALLAISSRDRGEGAGPDIAALTQAAAEVVAAQPDAKRAALTERIAGFLATQSGIGHDADAIAAAITSRVAQASQTVASVQSAGSFGEDVKEEAAQTRLSALWQENAPVLVR